VSIVRQTDVHHRDIVRVLNCGPSKIRDEDLDPTHGTHPSDDVLPDKVDLRREWWDIGNQGKSGACVGWAIADSLLRWHFVEAGKLPKEKHLSVRFVWMAAKETDDETREATTFIELAETKIEAGLNIIKRFGVVEEDTLPFFPTEMYGGNVEEFYNAASKFRIADYKSLIGPKEEGRLDPNLVCKWLAENRESGGGPVVVRIGTDSAFVKANKDNSLLEKYNAWEGAELGNHCAAIVGYQRQGSETFFTLRNSWGEGWGNGGYAYLSKEYLRGAVQEAWYIKI
jgi:hypothetical protein